MFNKIRHTALVVLFLLALASLYKTGFINNIFIPAMFRRIYIPVVFWAVVMLYAALVHAVCAGSYKKFLGTLKRTVITGFLIHIYMMLFDLVLALAKDNSFLSAYYFYYIKLLLVIFTFTISAGYIMLIDKLKKEGAKEPVCQKEIFAPLALLPVCFVLYSVGRLGIVFILVLSAAYLIPYLFTGKGLNKFVGFRVKTFLMFLFKNDRNFIIFVFLLAFLIRGFFAINIVMKTETPSAHNFISASDDGDAYDGAALRYMNGGKDAKIRIWGGNYDEGYAIFLICIYKIFGRNFYAITLIQSFIGAFLPVIVFLIGKILFSRMAGICAALALAFKGALVFLSVVCCHESVWIPLVTVVILMLTKYYKDIGRTYVNMAIGGAVLGLVCVLRGLFLYFVPFVILWIAVIPAEKIFGRRLKSIVVFCFFLAVVLFSFSIVFDSPLNVGSKERMSVLWHNSKLTGLSDSIGNEALGAMGVNFILDPVGSVKNIARNPVRFVSMAVRIYPIRIVSYLGSYQFGYFDPTYLINYARQPNNFMPTLEFYFTLFFVCGLILCLGRPDILKSPVFLILAFNITIFALVLCIMSPRFKEASTPFIYLIGSYGAVKILESLNVVKKEGAGS